MSPKVFLVTGCSTGFGKYLVQEIIDKGDICVATARNPDQLEFNNTSDKVIGGLLPETQNAFEP